MHYKKEREKKIYSMNVSRHHRHRERKGKWCYCVHGTMYICFWSISIIIIMPIASINLTLTIFCSNFSFFDNNRYERKEVSKSCLRWFALLLNERMKSGGCFSLSFFLVLHLLLLSVFRMPSPKLVREDWTWQHWVRFSFSVTNACSRMR
jgi:hypothetical protein